MTHDHPVHGSSESAAGAAGATARPASSKSARTRESILVAAEDLFSERGFAATSLDAIGRRAGVGGTAVLYHYATKAELFGAVLDRIFGPLLDDLHRLLDGDGPVGDRLVAITATMVRFAADRPAAARLILREATGSGADARSVMERATARHWTRLTEVLATDPGHDTAADPIVVWNVIVGAICFYFGAGPTVGGLPHDPTAPDRAAAFETLMVDITRAMSGSDHDRHAGGS